MMYKAKRSKTRCSGRARCQQWKDGQIELKDLIDQRGRLLTLEQLKQLDEGLTAEIGPLYSYGPFVISQDAPPGEEAENTSPVILLTMSGDDDVGD